MNKLILGSIRVFLGCLVALVRLQRHLRKGAEVQESHLWRERLWFFEIRLRAWKFNWQSNLRPGWLWHRYCRTFFCSTLAQAFAANCICKTPSISTRWGLYTVHKPSSSRDSNPGLLGVKRQHYLCAIHDPHTKHSGQSLKLSRIVQNIFCSWVKYRCKDSKQLFFSSRTLPKLFIWNHFNRPEVKPSHLNEGTLEIWTRCCWV